MLAVSMSYTGDHKPVTLALNVGPAVVLLWWVHAATSLVFLLWLGTNPCAGMPAFVDLAPNTQNPVDSVQETLAGQFLTCVLQDFWKQTLQQRVICYFRFLRLDDLESFLEDAERTAAAEDDDPLDADAEDRLGEGLYDTWHVAS